MYDVEKSRKKEATDAKAKQLEKISAMDSPCCEPYVYLPNFSLKKTDLPEMANWKVGDEQEILIKVRMTGYEEHKSLNSEESTSRGEFDIIGIEPEVPAEEKKLS